MSSNNALFLIHVPAVLYENRYCNQEGFSVFIFGGEYKNRKCLNRVFKIKVPSFKVTELPSMVKPHYNLHLVTNNSDIFAIVTNQELDEILDISIASVEIYSDKNKTWNHQYVQVVKLGIINMYK